MNFVIQSLVDDGTFFPIMADYAKSTIYWSERAESGMRRDVRRRGGGAGRRRGGGRGEEEEYRSKHRLQTLLWVSAASRDAPSALSVLILSPPLPSLLSFPSSPSITPFLSFSSDSRPPSLLANQPQELAGCLDIDASVKARGGEREAAERGQRERDREWERERERESRNEDRQRHGRERETWK